MKIVTAFFKYDYGIKERGESLEKKFFFTAMKNLGCQVAPFWLEENGYPDSLDKLQENLLAFTAKEKPEIVFFVLMKDEVRHRTLEELGRNCVTVNWFCDDQWRFDNFTKYTAPKLSYSVTVDKFSILKYREIGYSNAILSQWAAFDYEENPELKQTGYKHDISFVGAKNRTREWIISELRNSGYKVDCFGAGWENGRVSYERMKEIFLSSKINLNLSNSVPSDFRFILNTLRTMARSLLELNLKKVKKSLGDVKFLLLETKRTEQIKARNFEIPGCGGFQLTQYALSIEDFYEIGKEIAVFANLDDLKLQIGYYLANEEKRHKIRDAGHLRTKEYTYEKQLKRVLDEIKSRAGRPSEPAVK